MLIDWFTVGAQALNFLILVWLMKRFLYKPILHAIDAREKRIATGTRRRRREKGRSPKGARRVPAQERGVRPTARRALEQSDRRGTGRTSAAPRRSAEGRCGFKFKTAGNVEKRSTELTSSNQPPDTAGSICHRTKGADGSRRDEFGRTPGRGVHSPLARDGRPGESRPRRGP